MAGFTVESKNRTGCPHGRSVSGAVPMDGQTLECPPVDVWSDVACLLEDYAPPQDWERGEAIPEAVKLALSKIGNSLEKQSVYEATGMVGSFVLTILREAVREKGALLQEAREHELRGAVEK